MACNREKWIGCRARSIAAAPVLAPHVLSVIPALMNLPRATRMAGSTTQRRGSKMDSSSLNICYRDGSIGSITVRDRNQVINTRRKLMEDGWIVMQNQTFLDSTVEQRQIEHNDAVKQFLQVDEGTYLPRRFRKREVDASDSLLVPPNGISGLQIVYVLHLGGQINTAWIFEYLPTNEPSRRSVSLSGTDIIFVAGWMKDWRIPYVHGQATGLLTEIIYVQQRPFV